MAQSSKKVSVNENITITANFANTLVPALSLFRYHG